MTVITTDERKVILTWGKIIPAVAALLMITNTVTGLVFNQERNTEDIIYNDERSDRKDKSVIKEIKQLIYISELETEIKRLKRHQCND